MMDRHHRRVARGRRSVLTLGVLAGAIALALLPAACHEDYPTCYAGDYRACSCANGATGYQQCNVAKDDFDPCPCDGKTPIADASADTGVVPASRQYMESCTTDSDCATHVCGAFPTRGNKCTKPCANNADCPPPSPGCNPQAICKSP